jgi:hypothetical protein
LTHDEVFAGKILAEGNDTRNGRVKVISGFEKDWHSVFRYFENVKEMAHYLSSLGGIRWFGYLSIRFDKELLFGGLTVNEIFGGQSHR